MIARSHGARDLPSTPSPKASPKANKTSPTSPAARSASPASASTSRSPSRSPGPPEKTTDKQLYPGNPRSLSGIALRSFLLGTTLTVSLFLLALGTTIIPTPLWRLPFFFAALSTFHFLEFWSTARYNTPAANIDAFLLTANWPAYAIAHASATLECLVTNLFFPHRSWAASFLGNVTPLCIALGLIMVGIGQFVRTTAMVQCGESFNHIIQQHRKSSHFLVTHGVYALFRHPSYFGFFWWSLGTQLVLGNVFCGVGYAVVVWRFFAGRIPHEERFLVGFFGGEYVEYRRRVGTWIPFIS